MIKDFFAHPLCVVQLALCIVLAADVANAGFYRVEQDAAGAWRLIDPAGQPTVWLGVDHVKFDGFRCEADGNRKHYRETNERQFGTPEAWASNTVERLRSWGFNGLGAGCNNALFKGSGLGRCVFLALGDSATAEKDDEEHWLSDNLHTPGTAFPNVFNPDFAEHCDREAEKACAPNRDDPEVLGYFIDNELAWEARKSGPAGEWGLFDNAARKPAGNSARMALEAFLKERLAQSPQSSQSGIDAETQRRGETQSLEEQSPKETSWTSRTSREEIFASLRLCVEKGDLLAVPVEIKREFVEFVAEKYFEITTSAIRRHDPNHLVLGCRFAGTIYPDEVFRAAGKYCDIVSINGYAEPIPDRNEMVLSYRGRYYPIAETFSKIGAVAGRPIMLTEWSFPAFDSGLPCLRGVGKRFDTQAERAWASALYARSVLSSPWVIGYDYFMWVDMPAKGISFRFPEDANYGLVREDGTEYAELTEAFAAIQRRDGLDFDEWRRQIATRGPLEPPSWTPRLRVDYLDAEYIPVADGATPPSFVRDGDDWRVTNAAGLELRGRVGGPIFGASPDLSVPEAVISLALPLESIAWRGVDYGSFSAEIAVRGVFDPKNPDGYAQQTHRVERIVGVEWRETDDLRGILALDCDLGVARMALEIGVAPESTCLHIDVRRIENTSDEALEITDITLLPDAPFPEATVPPKVPRPGFMSRPHCTRAWIDHVTGHTLGVLTDSAFANVIDFIAGEDDARRSAVRFMPGRPIHGSKQLLLAPGEGWTPEAPLHALVRPGEGGAEEWEAFAKAKSRKGGTSPQ